MLFGEEQTGVVEGEVEDHSTLRWRLSTSVPQCEN